MLDSLLLILLLLFAFPFGGIASWEGGGLRGGGAELAGSLRDLGAGAQNWLTACVGLRRKQIDVM